jgi:hypothetical protein
MHPRPLSGSFLVDDLGVGLFGQHVTVKPFST